MFSGNTWEKMKSINLYFIVLLPSEPYVKWICTTDTFRAELRNHPSPTNTWLTQFQICRACSCCMTTGFPMVASCCLDLEDISSRNVIQQGLNSKKTFHPSQDVGGWKTDKEPIRFMFLVGSCWPWGGFMVIKTHHELLFSRLKRQ